MVGQGRPRPCVWMVGLSLVAHQGLVQGFRLGFTSMTGTRTMTERGLSSLQSEQMMHSTDIAITGADDDAATDIEAAAQPPVFTQTDRKHMRRALELAARSLGKTRPNPAVGCVVLDSSGEVVGEGFHPKAGEPHAEVFALREAQERARGGTAYVTLEPCNHFGRTPPCVDALLQAGVRKVIAGMVDPFPLVGGKGLERLKANGVEVAVGCEEERCRQINRPFIHRVLHGRPFGAAHVLYTQGALRLPNESPLLVSGVKESLVAVDALVFESVHTLERLANDGTRLLPELQDTVVRVLMAPTGIDESVVDALVWDAADVRRVVVTIKGGASSGAADALRNKGVTVVESDHGDPRAVADHLHKLGMLSVLWLVEHHTAKLAVEQGVIQEMSIWSSLEEADELNELVGSFGRPISTSIISCDALDTQACVLKVSISEEAEVRTDTVAK